VSNEPKILFEDNHCLIINKPAGLSTQAPEAFPSLESWARSYLQIQHKKTGRPYLGIPHRLDRPVSGIVFFTRSSKAAARIAEQFRDRKIAKRYLALVEGILNPLALESNCCWLDYMRKIPDQARGEICTYDSPGAKLAQLEMQSLGFSENTSLLDIHLQTGRMHQIRLQASSRGFPICGDYNYNASPNSIRNLTEKCICLHSYFLRFYHPITYQPMEVISPLPHYFPSWAKELAVSSNFSSPSDKA